MQDTHITEILVILTLGFTILSGVDYLVKNRKVLDLNNI